MTRPSAEVTQMKISKRSHIWKHATELVAPIIEQHGLETYKSGSMFGPYSTFTPVDQHIEQIIRVADWLLGE